MENSQSNHFDVIIAGNGLKPLLLLNQAAGKGLNVLLIADKDLASNSGYEPFCILKPPISFNVFKILKFNNLIQRLQKSFLHLFVQSKTESSQYTRLFERVLIVLNRHLFMQKSEKDKVSGSHRTIKSFKFSINRMTITLLKQAAKQNAQFYSYTEIISLQYSESKTYIIKTLNLKNHSENTFYSKKVINFYLDNSALNIENLNYKYKTEPVYYFTYPISKLKINKNIIYKDNNLILKIIPWFESVYFEFTGFRNGIEQCDEFLNFVNHKFKDSQLHKSEIQTFGQFLTIHNQKTQAVIYNNQNCSLIKYRPVYQWFDYSNNIVNHLFNNKKGNSIIGQAIFPGSDLNISPDPLRIMELADEKFDMAKQILKSPAYFKKLFYRYGSDIEYITDKAYENWNKTKNSEYSWLKAEIEFCIESEFCLNAHDFIQNRTELWMEKDVDIELINQIFNELQVF